MYRSLIFEDTFSQQMRIFSDIFFVDYVTCRSTLFCWESEIWNKYLRNGEYTHWLACCQPGLCGLNDLTTSQRWGRRGCTRNLPRARGSCCCILFPLLYDKYLYTHKGKYSKCFLDNTHTQKWQIPYKTSSMQRRKIVRNQDNVCRHYFAWSEILHVESKKTSFANYLIE